jgi:isocitrate/isopropylmalate dehydrogenase
MGILLPAKGLLLAPEPTSRQDSFFLKKRKNSVMQRTRLSKGRSAWLRAIKGYVEPAHGSAPEIAGQNCANPYSMIGSMALMPDKCFGLEAEAADIRAGMHHVFTGGYRTSELAGPVIPVAQRLATNQFGNKVVAYIRAA